MVLRFDNRVVVVTGAGAGLGREYALLFGKRGAKVVVNDLGGNFHGEGNSSRAADLVVEEIRKLGGTAVADYNSVVEGHKIIETAISNYGRIDVLVNNAGILRDKSIANISDNDWNLIHDVHLKGSFMTTRAAWPYFKKQKFGRIIMTTSNSGIYGNFGQANYSAAKLGLIGLANTVAIEGAKYNVHCNTICPTAASRMTKGILPDDLFDEMKPELIAPVVVYLCHEDTMDNGQVIESAVGFATKVHFVRGKGSLIRDSIKDVPTPETVKAKWGKITDMKNAKHFNSNMEVSSSFVSVMDRLKNPLPKDTFEDTYTYTFRDTILYALGIGVGTEDESNLKFIYENHPNFAAFPTYAVIPSIIMLMTSSITPSALENFDLSQVLHGEQFIEIVNPMRTEGTLTTRGNVIDVQQKKSGVVVTTECLSYDEGGQLMTRSQSSTFIVRGKSNGKYGGNPEKVINIIPNPSRQPDHTSIVKTNVDQAALYRLSGDLNPLHIDPNFALLGGFNRPIIHGLCTFGVSVRAVLKQYADNDPSLFKAVKVRFTKPVFPGDTLKVEMWQEGNRIHFRTLLAESNTEVISGAYVDLLNVIKSTSTSESIPQSSSNMALQSDAVFAAIKERVNADKAKAKSVNGVFLYKITKDGKVAKEWTLDLKNAVISEGAPSGKADTTITIADEDFIDIALGKLNPQQAFMKGKLKIQGNIMLAQKLSPLLKTDAKL
ncbi:hypothetical protein PVAND_012125 [Polypedilum vanderplanki]|uniref:Peroxisomal multifunctional enzyme type 2 n=1 Tax=Polypedilum vanderplanki TaxID=319348 RepID=A0A9J6CLH3_POLVA|nr:hypothetical protein PVAND_012125 [Polypedilum vanderplanki]